MKKKEELKASRRELLIRIPYFIAFYFVFYFIYIAILLWGIWAGLMFIFNWVYILITGKRGKFMHDQINAWYNFTVQRVFVSWVYQKCLPYFLLLTDQRPGFKI